MRQELRLDELKVLVATLDSNYAADASPEQSAT